MPSKKRFRIGNMTVNLGKLDDFRINKTGLFTLTGTDCGCGINYSTLPPTNNITCNQYTPQLSLNCCFGFSPPVTGCGCGVNYSTLPPTTVTVLDSQPVLSDVKASLINKLKEIEAYELELEVQETPQTIEEMDALENELENSLKELKELKKNFRG